MAVFNVQNFLRILILPFTGGALIYMLLVNLHAFGGYRNDVSFDVMEFASWFAIFSVGFLLLIFILRKLKYLLVATFFACVAAGAMTYMYEKNNLLVEKTTWAKRGNPGPVYPWEKKFWCHALPFGNCE